MKTFCIMNYSVTELCDVSDNSLIKALSDQLRCGNQLTAHFYKDSQRGAFKDVFDLLMWRLGRCRCIDDLRKCPTLLSIMPNVYSRHAVTAHFIGVILINSAMQTHCENRFDKFLILFVLDETSRYKQNILRT